MSDECDKCGEHALECGCPKYKYRRYRRMTEEEQKKTGYPTDYESIKDGIAPISLILGYDPFVTFDDIESVTPPPSTVT